MHILLHQGVKSIIPRAPLWGAKYAPLLQCHAFSPNSAHDMSFWSRKLKPFESLEHCLVAIYLTNPAFLSVTFFSNLSFPSSSLIESLIFNSNKVCQ